jgi:hypothetical protein
MKLVELPKGFIPPDTQKKKRSGKFVLYFLIYLCISYVAKSMMEDNSVKEINRQAPIIASSVESMSPHEQERLGAAKDRAEDIIRKYLSPDEYTQAQAIGLKELNGTATINDLNLTSSYWKKVLSLASASEKETLDEWTRIARKISERIQNIPGEVASPKPRGNVLIGLLLAPISFIRDPVGYLNNYPFYITIWVIALIWYGLRQRKRSKALKDKISDQKKKAF